MWQNIYGCLVIGPIITAEEWYLGDIESHVGLKLLWDTDGRLVDY